MTDPAADRAEDIAYGCPTALIFADSEAGIAAWREAAEPAGCRIGAALPIEAAAARLDEQSAMAIVLVDVTRDAGDALDRLLDRLDQAARGGRYPSVVALTPDLIDIAIARAPHRDVALLCPARAFERAGALGLALAPRPRGTVREGSERPLQLHQLSEEVGRIARQLAELSQTEPAGGPLVRPSRPGEAAGEPDATRLRGFIRARRLRDQYFEPTLFADPAWDMLLDLMAARLEHRQVAVSSLCIAAAVPPTTALRWIKTLTDTGLLVRVADPRDGRRVFLELSDEGAAAMTAYLAAFERLAIV